MSEDLLNVVMFSGGRGANSIARALLGHRQVRLTLLVNAYDDGLSTGALRRYIPGMLGPSDVRKNVSLLIDESDRAQKALRSLIEYRFASPIENSAALQALRGFAELRRPIPVPALNEMVSDLSVGQIEIVSGWMKAFLGYAMEQEGCGAPFNYSDCSFGNLMFAGAYLESGRRFNDAVSLFSSLCRIRGSVLNVTDGENLVLSAIKADGSVLFDEATIVSEQNPLPLDDLFLTPSYLSRSEWEGKPAGSRRAELSGLSRIPKPNPEAIRALENADVVIYGPGTQHSSLFPSYLTTGVAEAIAGNTGAEKIFVCNIRRDFEIQGENAQTIARKFLRYMNRKDVLSKSWASLVNHFFAQNPADDKAISTQYVPLGEAELSMPKDSVVLTDWEQTSGVHSGARVVDELVAIVNGKLQNKLKPFHYTVSIIVPALNEERTVTKVLHDLELLNFAPLGIGKEIIFVDGGSSDRTFELARSVRGVRAFRLDGGRGRGDAFRFGIEKAMGNVIAFFPSDDEYVAEELIQVVQGITANGFNAVYGSRAIKCVNLSTRIYEMYRGNLAMYVVSKYGGMLLSGLGLLLYNRFVSDPLTGVKAFDARVLRELRLSSPGFEFETELFAKLGLRRQFILEIPISCTPRTRQQGKKTTIIDGIRALIRLISTRFLKA